MVILLTFWEVSIKYIIKLFLCCFIFFSLSFLNNKIMQGVKIREKKAKRFSPMSKWLVLESRGHLKQSSSTSFSVERTVIRQPRSTATPFYSSSPLSASTHIMWVCVRGPPLFLLFSSLVDQDAWEWLGTLRWKRDSTKKRANKMRADVMTCSTL